MIAKNCQWLRMSVPSVAMVLLTACGGGSSGSNPTVTYDVSATAGIGGGISPATATVDAGDTANFTVTANSGYAVSGVSGCGGALAGNTYTTGAVNGNCTVMATFLAQYAVTALAGSGGTVSPASATVNSDGMTTFTVTPNAGYVISSVTGCGGTLSGNTYTTGMISANCVVAASFSAAFTWVGGSNTADAGGDYGSQGIAAPSNVPGARHAPVTWADAAGNLWLFGGYGVGSPIFNDLWEYSPASGEWIWISGSSTPNAIANYGTQGMASPANVPGAHGSSRTWTDASGNLWMFGGYGYGSTGTQGWLNALWEFSPATGMWAWVGGSETVNAKGVYGAQGIAAATNMPGARAQGSGPTSALHVAGGNIWLFGGYGYDSTGAQGWLNDLWEYSSASGEWTWVNGPNTANANGVYGTQGVAAAANVPPSGVGLGWSDARGNLWAFGGYAQDSTGIFGYLNDLWEYSPASGEWTWVGGSATANAKGVYGTQGVAAAANMPGARTDEAQWTDPSGNLWLVGGYGYDSAGTLGELNDLWKYSPVTGMWTWVDGSETANANGVYGTLGVASAADVPGARDAMAVWIVGNGNVWLFGGEGYNATGADPSAPQWNDLWKYPTQ
ncbi:MAG TPA: kelch repeat-containing protein [Steroidobacteraceae bacterium]|jgi:N-acetylneuraminic acid mutarotase|nr:kelch repeat-containing protein [Steroidobacteraceae bacterium]